MSEQTDSIEPDSTPPAETAPPAVTLTAPASAARRTVTVPVLPLAIVGGVIVALLFLGGGVAIGYGVASHEGRSDRSQFFPGIQNGDDHGFAPGQGQGPGQGQRMPGDGQQNRPGDRSTTAPKNG